MEHKKEGFHEKLKRLMDEYVNTVYDYTAHFPREELYGITSQFRRSALSVVLNYIEGYARQGEKEYRRFLRTSYASLQESRYLSEFSAKRKYLTDAQHKILEKHADEISKMLWSTMTKLGDAL